MHKYQYELNTNGVETDILLSNKWISVIEYKSYIKLHDKIEGEVRNVRRQSLK